MIGSFTQVEQRQRKRLLLARWKDKNAVPFGEKLFFFRMRMKKKNTAEQQSEE